jgi:predicted nucleotidyltransferase
MAVDYEAVTQIARDFAIEAKKILPVSRAVLFGSYAKGNARDESDIDVCKLSEISDNSRTSIPVRTCSFPNALPCAENRI